MEGEKIDLVAKEKDSQFQSVAGFHHQGLPHLARGVTIISMMTASRGQGEAVLSIWWKLAWKEAASFEVAPRPAVQWPSYWKEVGRRMLGSPGTRASLSPPGCCCKALPCEATSSQLAGYSLHIDCYSQLKVKGVA